MASSLLKQGKLFILSMLIWGLLQLTCGLVILVGVVDQDHWNHHYPLNEPLFLLAASSSFITAGKCTIAFGYFRESKGLKIAVVVTSVLSMIFGVAHFLLLEPSSPRDGNTLQRYAKREETVHISQETVEIETTIYLGSVINAVFLLIFIPNCRKSGFGFDHLEEETDNDPPPYNHHTIEAGVGNHQSCEAASPPPIYTISEGTQYQSNITIMWQNQR